MAALSLLHASMSHGIRLLPTKQLITCDCIALEKVHDDGISHAS